MNLNQALEYASAFFIPEFIYGGGYEVVESERRTCEEAIRVLDAAWRDAEAPGFSYSLVRELGDRNRSLCDEIGPSRLEREPQVTLSRGLTDADLCAGIAALQGRGASEVEAEVRGDRGALAVAYVRMPVRGTVLGVDIETTSRDPERGYIVNTGWELMDLASDAHPRDGVSRFSGLPDRYRETGVPLARIHGITWNDIDGKPPFREDKALQEELLRLLCAYPYMAHNAAFEDAWFTMHLDGYAEARREGRITVIDTRDVCRRLDPDATALPRETSPASMEAWARRRGTLAVDESERHLGLADADLMLRTVHAEFARKDMFES